MASLQSRAPPVRNLMVLEREGIILPIDGLSIYDHMDGGYFQVKWGNSPEIKEWDLKHKVSGT